MKLEALRIHFERAKKRLKRSDSATLPAALLGSESVLNAPDNRIVLGSPVEVITSRNIEPFMNGMRMEVIEPSSHEFDYTASVFEKVISAKELEHPGEMLWQALRKAGKAKIGVRFKEVFDKFLKENIKPGGIWQGEHAIIYRFDGGEKSNESSLQLVRNNQDMSEDDDPRFRAIIREGSFNGGIEEISWEEDKLVA